MNEPHETIDGICRECGHEPCLCTPTPVDVLDLGEAQHRAWRADARRAGAELVACVAILLVMLWEALPR